MLKTLVTTIPKSVNEIIFILGFLGLYFFLKKEYKQSFARIIFTTIFFMIAWRVAFQIRSARYASALIYPFIFFSVFFIKSLWLYNRKISIFVLALVLSPWITRFVCVSAINTNLMIIGELHDRFKDNNNVLITHSKDASRIQYYEKNGYQIIPYSEEKTYDDLVSYAQKYKSVNLTTLYDLVFDTSQISNIKREDKDFTPVLSVFSQKNKKKRHCVFLIKPHGVYQIISNNIIIKPESGILENGDIELLDSPLDSYNKLKKNIANYADFYDFNPSILTPKNAYFHNDSRFTQNLPYYTCISIDPLSGNNSAYIKIRDAYGYLFFEQKFSNGTYAYSALIRGKKRTKVRLVYDAYYKKKWNPTPIADFIIPDNRTYQITNTFSVNYLKKDDFFLVGVFVQNGEVYLDNLTLKKKDD